MVNTEKKLIGFVHNSKVPDALHLAKSLITKLRLSNTWVSSAGEIQEFEDKFSDTHSVVIIGGDGTILRALRVLNKFSVPVIGIKMGKIGFMAELSPENSYELLPKFLDSKLNDENLIRIEKRMMLEANIIQANSTDSRLTLHALNEISVGNSKVSRLVELETAVNHIHLTNFRADAVIISTATGSTGYALSAGGPIIFPEAEMMLLQPVAAHTGLRDGLILDPKTIIELKPSLDYEASISADGFEDTILNPGEKVLVTKSPNSALFLRAHQPDFFYEALNMRLGLAYRTQRQEE
ncbi:MAG: NAD(+)/NADH kinase [SAR202 cluster bacterium]|nr:NAD(+)/NADH kinase [SAR202 cluster bacterium]